MPLELYVADAWLVPLMNQLPVQQWHVTGFKT